LKITPKNLIYHNLVGLRIKVKVHPDAGIEGLEGKVVGETKNFLFVDAEGSVKKVQKLGYFEFTLPDGRKVVVSSEAIRGRPEERLKRFLKA